MFLLLRRPSPPLSHAFDRDVSRDDDYGEAKRQAESAYFKQAKFPVTAVRLPIVLGEDDYTRRLHFHVERILSGKPIHFPSLEARISFIDSADAAAGLAFLAAKPAEGPVNFASPEPIRIRALLDLIEAAAGSKVVLASEVTPENLSPFGLEADWFMSTKRAEEIGFRAKPLPTWLPQLIDQLVKNFKTAQRIAD